MGLTVQCLIIIIFLVIFGTHVRCPNGDETHVDMLHGYACMLFACGSKLFLVCQLAVEVHAAEWPASLAWVLSATRAQQWRKFTRLNGLLVLRGCSQQLGLNSGRPRI
jgi:hypothetical protein